MKVVSESRVTWATSVPILVFLGLCSRLRPDLRDRQTDVRQHHRLMHPPIRVGGIIRALGTVPTRVREKLKESGDNSKNYF